MNRITYLAGVLAVIAFPAFAEEQPKTITVAECEAEKILLMLEMVREDITAMQQDLLEIQGDQEDSPPKKIYK